MRRLLGCAFVFGSLLCAPSSVCAQSAAPTGTPPAGSPSASPTASPSPTPVPGFHLSGAAFADFVNTATSGSGTNPPEGAGFANGSPLSPNTPYDVWSSAPLTPGVAGLAQLQLTGSEVGSRYDVSATLGFGALTGSMQNVLYWGSNLLPTFNSHIGATNLPYAISFPMHAGQEDTSASIVSPLFGSFGAHDGSWQLRGGFFDMVQSDRFVFVQSPFTNVSPNIGLQTAESLGNGPAALDSWPALEPGLPLHGYDFVGKQGIAQLEVTSAALPALPGDSTRANIASLVFDHGEGTRYSFSYLHVWTGGTPIFTTTYYGADPHATPGPQGNLQSSTLGGQSETIAGARAAVHLSPATDGVVEIGQTWYNADMVSLPGTNRPGGFYHVGATAHHHRSTLELDLWRFEARYANAILPYGTPENVWSAGWAWPGVWLKSTYQLVDNTIAPGSNRQGYRLRYGLDHGPLEFHAAYSTFHQIEPSTATNMQQVGFVDGFFLVQADPGATLGTEHQYNAWIAWHPSFGDLTLDYADDTMFRPSVPTQPVDAVTYQAPQVVFTFAHTFSKYAVADAGYGRYAMRGTWAQTFTNVDYSQSTAFVGAQLAESRGAAILIQLRRAVFAGLPSAPNDPPPNFAATTFILEQRYGF